MQGGNNQNQNNGQQFDLQEALECRRLEVDEQAMQYYMYKNGGGMNNNAQNYYNYNQAQNNNKMELFVGPYCANGGKKILLGVFMDETCSYSAPSGTYEKMVSTHYMNRNIIYLLQCSDFKLNFTLLIVLWKLSSFLQRLSRQFQDLRCLQGAQQLREQKLL